MGELSTGDFLQRLLLSGPDADGDAVPDAADNCPAIANASHLDTDADDSGDACDIDDDNDGLTDLAEAALGTNPLVADSDSDGVNDRLDAFPTNSAASLDDDGDGLPDAWNAGCDVTCQGASGLTLDTSVDCPDYICVPFTRGWRSVILRPSP
jgi:hypothetical protein